MPGDLLVLNETKVIPARLLGVKEGTDTPVETLLLKRLSLTDWEVILKPGRRLKPGARMVFGAELTAQVVDKQPDGVCRVSFAFQGSFEDILDRLGKTPLPPYIHDLSAPRERYQTVYAKTPGSAAAPTAGLHFTPELLERLEKEGVETARVLLHVGLGTFRPVKEERVEDHKMHAEEFELSERAAEQINRAKKEKRRVIAVGTTSVRVLESAADGASVKPGRGQTSIFLYPGVPIQVTDALITNFHLPQSTLLMLVAAFTGREEALNLYREAVEKRYRFFSFGDAMFIH